MQIWHSHQKQFVNEYLIISNAYSPSMAHNLLTLTHKMTLILELHQCPSGHCKNNFFIIIQIRKWKFDSALICCCKVIDTTFCTAVIPCANFHSNMIPHNEVILKPIFHRFQISMEKSLVKRVLGPCYMTLTETGPLFWWLTVEYSEWDAFPPRPGGQRSHKLAALDLPMPVCYPTHNLGDLSMAGGGLGVFQKHFLSS